VFRFLRAISPRSEHRDHGVFALDRSRRSEMVSALVTRSRRPQRRTYRIRLSPRGRAQGFPNLRLCRRQGDRCGLKFLIPRSQSVWCPRNHGKPDGLQTISAIQGSIPPPPPPSNQDHRHSFATMRCQPQMTGASSFRTQGGFRERSPAAPRLPPSFVYVRQEL